MLGLEGYATAAAENGRDALEILRATRPSPFLLLIDLMMPVMNGWEFLKSRNADTGLTSIPVIVVTAAGQLGNLEPSSVQGFLKKPIELDTLLDAVKKFYQ